MKQACLAFCLVFLVHSPAFDSTIVVPGDHATISAAISAASDHDTIIVSPGEYVIARSLAFGGKSLHLKSESGPEQTVIRMGNPLATPGSVLIFEDGETEEAMVEGFTVTGGIGTGTDNSFGGGIVCLNGSGPTLKSLIITENRATYGGAVYCQESSPTLVDCRLTRNHVQCGGGMYCDAASPTLLNCQILGNRGSYASSGIHCKNKSSPVIESCWIVGNCTYMGGGLDCFNSSPRLTNCVIAGNFAQKGGAVYCENSSPVLANCTIVGNSADEGGGVLCMGSFPTLVNSIIWGNLRDYTSYDDPHCLYREDPRFVQDGAFEYDRFVNVEITGQLCELPDFVTIGPDYHLHYDSPAIDLGASADAPATDIEGNPRPCGLAIDIGAYEFQSPECSGESHPFRRGDANGDGALLISDPIYILLYLFEGGPSPTCLDALDVDDTGDHDITDAVYLLSFLFLGGPPPSEPFGECGSDPTADELTCASFSLCK